MRLILLLLSSFALSIVNYCTAQTLVVEEQSISACYLSDCMRPSVSAVVRAEAEVKGLFVVAYLDCKSPITDECNVLTLGQYTPNSIHVNGRELKLRNDVFDDEISVFNLGRFFAASDSKMKYLIFEMANVGDSEPDSHPKYSYVTICLNANNEIVDHFFKNDYKTPLTDEELLFILEESKYALE